jgi:proline dehydrogenase
MPRGPGSSDRATPPGRGGIGVVRISGPDAHRIVVELTQHGNAFEPRYATVAAIRGPAGRVDRALVTAFTAPHSYTGEDVAEISAHGSPILLQTIVGEAMRLGARLAEPGEIAHRKRADVDAAFAGGVAYLLEHGTYPRLATHDDQLIDVAKTLATRMGLGRDAFEFQMLYGVRPSLQHALIRDGWRLCTYVPFGTEWYPYFTRRLAERPANLMFFLRALRDT